MRNRYIALSVILLLSGFALRIINLMQMPFQWLEAFNVTQAHVSLLRSPFDQTMEMRKWLAPPFLALLDPAGPEAPWIARYISVLLGMLSIAACIGIVRALSTRKMGVLAGLLYAILPLAVFHERQALADVMLATCTTLATLFAIWTVRRPHAVSSVLLGIALAGAYLTKVSAVPYFLLAGWAILLLTPPNKWIRAGGWIAVAVIIAGLLIVVPYQRFVEHNPWLYSNLGDALVDQFRMLSETSSSPDVYQAYIIQQIDDLLDLTPYYIGWLMLLLTAAGIIVAIPRKSRQIAFLAVPALVFVLPLIFSQSSASNARDPFLAARYLLPNMAPLIGLTCIALDALYKKAFSLWHLRAVHWAAISVVLLIIVPWLGFDFSLFGDPKRISLSRVDKLQYITGQATGYGFREASEYMLAISIQTNKPIHVLTYEYPHNQLQAMIGIRPHSVEQFAEGDTDQRMRLASWLARGHTVFIFQSGSQQLASEPPYGSQLEEVASYDSAWGPLRIYQITAVDGDFAQEIYAALSPDPAKLQQDYIEISPSFSGAEYIFIFPAKHASPLASAAQREVWPLEIQHWQPGSPPQVVLGFEELQSEKAEVDLLLVSESDTDPQRYIEMQLLNNGYRLDESWAGSLHRIRYVSGPAEPSLPSLEAFFEGQIQLVAGGALERSIRSGEALRISLIWQAGQVIRDSFKVFLHVANDEGALIAQSDSIPGAGLLPMTQWRPGNQIVDRFALRIPHDAAEGTYELRVGIYSPESGLRLPVINASEHGGDYVIIGHIEIQSP